MSWWVYQSINVSTTNLSMILRFNLFFSIFGIFCFGNIFSPGHWIFSPVCHPDVSWKGFSFTSKKSSLSTCLCGRRRVIILISLSLSRFLGHHHCFQRLIIPQTKQNQTKAYYCTTVLVVVACTAVVADPVSVTTPLLLSHQPQNVRNFFILQQKPENIHWLLLVVYYEYNNNIIIHPS